MPCSILPLHRTRVRSYRRPGRDRLPATIFDRGSGLCRRAHFRFAGDNRRTDASKARGFSDLFAACHLSHAWHMESEEKLWHRHDRGLTISHLEAEMALSAVVLE